MLIGTIIGIMLAISGVYAADLLRLDMGCTVTVPEGVGVVIKNELGQIIAADDTHLIEANVTSLDFGSLTSGKATIWLYLYNTGTIGLNLTWRAEGLASGLRAEVSHRKEVDWSLWDGTLWLGRGESFQLSVTLYDEGADPGNYSWTLVVEEA